MHLTDNIQLILEAVRISSVVEVQVLLQIHFVVFNVVLMKLFWFIEQISKFCPLFYSFVCLWLSPPWNLITSYAVWFYSIRIEHYWFIL